jgi:antitoxin component HigA of HigAB toxin-antitoxin module
MVEEGIVMLRPTTEAEYKEARDEIDRLWDKDPLTNEEQRKMECLAKLVNEYERARWTEEVE